MNVLAGDIGGTHVRLAIMARDDDRWDVVHERTTPSRDYDGLAPVVRAFLDDLPERPERACIGVPGPVVEGRAHLSNLDWTVDESSLATALGIPRLRLINDFAALGHAIGSLGPEDVVELQAGDAQQGGAIALIGAGTGLGQALVLWTGDRYEPFPSEGGHVDFAPRTEREDRLRTHLRAKYGHVSYERVVSGPGLVETYRYVVESGIAAERPELRAAMERGEPAAVISRHALDGSDAASIAALDVFVAVYGAQAGNLALTLRATGGVYIGGGIAPQIVGKLRDGAFIAAFRDKGRMAELLGRIPVRVIVAEEAGLIGAAAAAAQD
jgi:glucokinase